MATITTCPECEQQVTLPAQAHPQMRVLCPLCQAEYQLDEVLRRLPPQLVVLDAAGAATVWTADDEAEAESEAWTPLGANEALALQTSDSSSAQALDFGEHGEPNYEVGRPGPEAMRGIPTMAPLPGPRRRPSIVRQLVGVVGGGVLGLGLGYLALLWLGGPHKDFLGVGTKLPAFMVPAAFHDDLDVQRRPIEVEDSQFADLQNKFSSFAPEASEPASDSPTRAKRPKVQFGQDYPEPKEETPADFVIGELENQTAPDEPENAEPEGEALPLDETESATETTPAVDEAPQPSEAAPAQAEAVLVREAPRFEPTALAAELEDVQAHQQAFFTGSVEEKEARAKKGSAFLEFCELAQVVTFVEGSNEQVAPQKESVEKLLTQIVNSDAALQDVAYISSRWLKLAQRPKPGVLFAGKVLAVEQQGAAHWLLMTPLGDEQRVRVVTSEAPMADEGAVAVLLGSIIENPQEKIAGYKPAAAAPVGGDTAEAPAAENVIFSRLIVTRAAATRGAEETEISVAPPAAPAVRKLTAASRR